MSQKGKRDNVRNTYQDKSLCANKGLDCAHLSAAKAGLMWWCPARSQELQQLPVLKETTGN